MGAFDALGMAGTGMSAFRTELDATANNLANLNTYSSDPASTFQAVYVEVAPRVSGGVEITDLKKSGLEGVKTYQPDNPYADGEGFVYMPNITTSTEMVNLIQAQRGYQANARVATNSLELYKEGINIGKKG